MGVEELTTWLKVELKPREWTQADQASKSGLSESFISMFLAGKRDVGIQSIVALSSALEVTPIQVFETANLLPKNTVNLCRNGGEMTTPQKSSFRFSRKNQLFF
jgi:transcriptional regulator with XRE-family HTH domain